MLIYSNTHTKKQFIFNQEWAIYTLRAKSNSFCLWSSAKVSNKSAFKSLLSLPLKTCSNLDVDDFASFKEWTTWMVSDERTLFLHRGFLGPPLSPQVTMEEHRGWGLERFWRKPSWGNWNSREPITLDFIFVSLVPFNLIFYSFIVPVLVFWVNYNLSSGIWHYHKLVHNFSIGTFDA